MPALGFLKKKRTKDLPGSKDPASPSSPVGDSPVTSNPSSGFQDSIPSASSQTSYPSQNNSEKASDPGQPVPETQQQQAPRSSPQNDKLDQEPSQPQQPSTTNGNGPLAPAQTSSVSPQPMAGHGNGAASQGGATIPVIRATKGKYTLTDFAIQRTLGTGSFGRVHLVQSKHNQRFYAVKVLKKQQVVKMKQVEHTNDERRMLQRVKHPFLVTLWGTFQDAKNLYMVMDFVEGGELFSLLRKSQVSDSRASSLLPVILYVRLCELTQCKAIPKSGCQILCSRGHPGAGLLAFDAHHI
ncbi:camp-dependent protein kinase catalytic subunit [Xylographa parallela]|nr:camp-dependent protein kinase catalytic subunit [Xylographa parallela]